MAKTLPPLAWFRAFECAARHLNFTKAANELSLTQSAVSQHIRSLENRLGCSLFLRQHRKLFLTDEGRRLLPAVSKSIAQLKEAADLFDNTPNERVLTISVSASIAQWYIVPELNDFLGMNPDIDIRIISKIWADEFSGAIADVEIRFDSPNSADSTFELLTPDHMVLVAAPGTRGNLQDENLIGVAGTNDTWKDWAENNGYPENLKVRTTVESHGMAVDCARAGSGIALTSFIVAAPALANKSVTRFDPKMNEAIDGYYVRHKHGANSELASHFIQWIRERIMDAKSRALEV